MTETTDEPLRLEVRRGRNALAFVLLLPLTGTALWIAYSERATLGLGHWWVGVFVFLSVVTGYRLVRPRTPMIIDGDGVHVVTGMPVLGLRAFIEWSAVKRLRVTAAGMVLVELRDAERWASDRPWRVRANVRANLRKTDAAVVQPLRELAGHPITIVSALRAAAPVRVDAPQALTAAP